MEWKKRYEAPPSTCCWCEKEISQGTPVYSLPGTFRQDLETPPVKKEAYVIDVAVPKNMDSTQYVPLWAIVTGKDSDAKNEGVDLIFMLCSKKCGSELKEVLQTEIKFVQDILGF